MQTEFQVAYDARNLYVFLRMHDAYPDSIMHALSRRDVRGPSDQIKLIIDANVSNGTNDAQWYGNFVDDDTTAVS